MCDVLYMFLLKYLLGGDILFLPFIRQIEKYVVYLLFENLR